MSNAPRFAYYPRPKVRYKGNSIEERDAAVERLREFLRLNYMTGAQAAQRMGVRPETLYAWLQGKSRPKSAERIIAFLDSMPAERSGIMPVGYEYREYKNWRGIPKPRRCPFCKQAKGEISEPNRMYQCVFPNCGTTVPKCLVTLRNLETPMRTHQRCDSYH